ncbi:MAG: hypothetical protein ABUL67_03600, partial [Haliangium ochraceum]
HRRSIADELPPALGAALMAPEVMVDDAMSLHQRELVAAVYRVLAEELSNDAVDWLKQELPKRMAEHLVAGAPAADTPPQHGKNLATGAPGSDRPLSEAQSSRDSVAEGRPGSKHPISERRRCDSARGSAVHRRQRNACAKSPSLTGTSLARFVSHGAAGRRGV